MLLFVMCLFFFQKWVTQLHSFDFVMLLLVTLTKYLTSYLAKTIKNSHWVKFSFAILCFENKMISWQYDRVIAHSCNRLVLHNQFWIFLQKCSDFTVCQRTAFWIVFFLKMVKFVIICIMMFIIDMIIFCYILYLSSFIIYSSHSFDIENIFNFVVTFLCIYPFQLCLPFVILTLILKSHFQPVLLK